jgi:catechol 2,3-dioxygenase-like lactoylglutathione lyase family enzyme
MIQRMSHTTILVPDQDQAQDFYVNTLGFEVRTDAKMGSFRWLTVGPKGQPDLEIILMPIMAGPYLDEATCNTLRDLVRRGALATGVFLTADCQKTYEELKAKGVNFKSAPVDKFYGVEAILQDPFGNWFSLTQPKPWSAGDIPQTAGA